MFPGQGAQKVGMGRDWVEAHPTAQRTFEEADDALGMALSKLCWEGPEEELGLTANTQPALVATSTAIHRVAAEAGLSASVMAGHSLGEYSALVAAGALDFGDALRLVRRRGELMQEAVPLGAGAMAALIGPDEETVVGVARDAAEGQVVAVANLNSPGQTVIAGSREAVERAVTLAKERGAKKAVLLKVSAPFHSPLMAPAREGLEPLLAETKFADPAVPVVTNVDARPATTGTAARDALVRQVDSPVRWVESVEHMAQEMGVDTFFELGPGKVLSALIRRTVREARSETPARPGPPGGGRRGELRTPFPFQTQEMRMFRLDGKIALVTGASQGIGEAVARQLAGQGANLVLAARSVDKLEGLAGEIEAAGGRALPWPLDLASPDEIAGRIDDLPEEFADVHVLVNNAGITADTLLARMGLDAWQRVLDVNLTGTFAVTRALVRGMMRRRAGRIISMSSVVGLMGNVGQANYAASKAGLVGFSKSLAKELGGRGITVNVVAPGLIETAMTADLPESAVKDMQKQISLRRFGTPEDIAAAVTYLASDEAAYVTGQVLNVSGGLYI